MCSYRLVILLREQFQTQPVLSFSPIHHQNLHFIRVGLSQMSFTVRFTHMRFMSKRENKYFIPNPSGFSKMIGSLRPLLWMNSYVKSGTKQAENNMVVFYCWTKCQHSAIITLAGSCCHSAFIHVQGCAAIKCHQLYITFSLHVIDQFRSEPLTVDFLLQVKHPPAIDLFIRDAVIMVVSPRTSPL